MLIFARQHDDIIGEVEGHFIEREVGELDPLGEADVRVAILAFEGGGMVRIDLELPDLEGFGCDFANGLREGDLIEQPVGSAAFGDVLCAVGVEHVACDAVAMPLLRAGELAEIGFGECVLIHVLLLVYVFTPLRGAGAKAEVMRLPVMPPTRER